MYILIDKFVHEFNNSRQPVYKNHPEPPVGKAKIVANDQEKERRYIQMNTGILYERPFTYTDTSPYGYNHFHQHLTLDLSIRKKWPAFEIELKTEIGLHLVKMRSYFIDGNKSNLKEDASFIRDVTNFEKRQLEVYSRYNLEDIINRAYSCLSTYGIDADQFVR